MNTLTVRQQPELSNRNDFLFPLEQQFDKFFRDFFTDSTMDAVRASAGYPKVDIVEDDKHWMIKAAVPGLKSEDLTVEVLQDSPCVRISGQMSSEYREHNENSKSIYRELHKSRFRRDISLPPYVEGEPDAELKDGILSLKWKHNIEKPPETKKVSIKSG